MGLFTFASNFFFFFFCFLFFVYGYHVLIFSSLVCETQKGIDVKMSQNSKPLEKFTSGEKKKISEARGKKQLNFTYVRI